MKPSAISLCAGAGIGEHGAARVANTLLAVDNWFTACTSFMATHKDVAVRCGDIGDERLIEWAANEYGKIDCLIASPPCPSFSQANARARKVADPRSNIYLMPLEWVSALRPEFYVAENVQGVLSSPYLGLAKARLNSLGYKSATWLLDAADYGTPQHRSRCFLVAWRRGKAPKSPRPTHGPNGRRPYVTLGEAIASVSESDALGMGCERLSPMRRWLLSAVPPGGNWRDLKGERLRVALESMRPAKAIADRLASKADPDAPSSTLMTGPSCQRVSMPIHPGAAISKAQRLGASSGGGSKRALREPRPLSVVEFLLIQGVDWRRQVLLGSTADRYRQAGNGLPPQLIEAVLRALVK